MEKFKSVLRTVFAYRVRAYIYGVALASIPIAISEDLMDPKMAPLAIALLLAILKLSPDTPPQTDLPDVEV